MQEIKCPKCGEVFQVDQTGYEMASSKFQSAIYDIDKTIKALEKTKADLMSSDRNLRLANDKAQDLSIKNSRRMLRPSAPCSKKSAPANSKFLLCGAA